MTTRRRHQRVHDLAVIGLGPAGAALALRMARRGVRVVAVDQHRLPRETLCGEFLSSEAVARLIDLGLLDRHGRQDGRMPPRIEHLRVVAPAGTELLHRLTPPSLALSRSRLDAALVAAAGDSGAEIVDRWRAIAVERRPDGGCTVHGIDPCGRSARWMARQAVGAHGKAGCLNRTGPAPEPRLQASAGGRASGSGPAASTARTSAITSESAGFIAWSAHHRGAGPRATVELFPFHGGYCGVTPIEDDRFNVCALATREVFRGAGATLAGLIAVASRDNPALACRLDGLARLDTRERTAARMSFRRCRPVASPLLMVGDAAAMIAPLCGDGIGMALSSAVLAEEWLLAFLEGRSDHRGMLTGYARSWHRTFRRRLAIGRALQLLMLEPRRAAWAIRVCRTWPALTDWLVRHTRDVFPHPQPAAVPHRDVPRSTAPPPRADGPRRQASSSRRMPTTS
ncbi:MAG: NAD(P)/FAD-dependent oxidoreductase [Candidatus Eiseniibacteriota bacterium]|jgi:flavin-dependent dehydrogenase